LVALRNSFHLKGTRTILGCMDWKVQEGKLATIILRGRIISVGRFLGGREIAKVNLFTSNCYLASPSSTVQRNSFEPTGAIRPLSSVPAIIGWRALAKIFSSVVQSVVIPVVGLFSGRASQYNPTHENSAPTYGDKSIYDLVPVRVPVPLVEPVVVRSVNNGVLVLSQSDKAVGCAKRLNDWFALQPIARLWSKLAHKSSLKGLVNFSRYSIIIAALLLLVPYAYAQSTLVSGTIVDSSGQAWIHGSFQFTFQPSPSNPNAQYFLNGVPFNRFQTIPALGPGLLDGAGSFTNVAVPSNTSITPSGSTWSLQVCPLATATNGCFIANLTISGVNQTVTSSLVPPPIIVDLTNPPQAPAAYVDSEIIGARVGSSYWNLIDQTQHVCTFPVCVWVPLIGGAGNPGGLTTQVQVNNGGAFGGSPCMTFPSLTVGPVDTNCNAAFKGPNPYIDATLFGVRAVSGSGPSATVSCTSGLPTVTINADPGFVNGDGVALYGCGSGTIAAPAAPTVMPSLAAAQTGMLLDVPGLTGATTYCYQLVARSLMGATNVSPETCTTTGPASLGLQTNTITTATLSTTTATYTTSAAHGLVVGAHVVISGVTINISGGGTTNFNTSTNPFTGWFTVATVPDNTHFTVNLMSDSRNGAITAGTGGSVNYWNDIRITATETTGNFQYYVYGRVSGGSKTLIGTMWPQNSSGGFGGDATYLAFQDFGSTVTTFPNPPLYIPTTVPTAATNSMLATTIVSGAGTTSLVLAASAGNSISGQTIIFDDAITFLNAATFAANNTGGTSGPLMLPEPGNNALNYVFNSPISLGTGGTSRITVLQKGQLLVNEPITMTVVSWYGQPSSSSVIGSFAFHETTPITVKRASPGIYALSDVGFFDLQISTANANGTTLYIQDGGGIPVAGFFDDVFWGLGFGGNIYSNMGAVFRGGAGFYFKNTTISAPQNGVLTSTTPGLYFNQSGNAVFDNLVLSGVGIATRVNFAGNFLKVDAVYSQGNYEPYFSTVIGSGGTGLFFMDVRNSLFDTTEVPLLANYGGVPVNLTITNGITGASIASGSFPPGSSPRTSINMIGTQPGGGAANNLYTAQLNQVYRVRDGTLGQTFMGLDVYNRSMSLGPAYSLFSTVGPYPAPTCPVSAGGSIPVGTFSYMFAPIFPANGSEGVYSYLCTATTTTGNQTVTLSWTAIPGVIQYNVYRNGVALTTSPISATTFTDTLAGPAGNPAGTLAAGGPAGMHGSTLWGQTVQVGDRAAITSSAGAPPAGLCTTTTGGQIYLRTDGTTTTTLYVCDGSSGSWTAK
jgi:hypothetical protein